ELGEVPGDGARSVDDAGEAGGAHPVELGEAQTGEVRAGIGHGDVCFLDADAVGKDVLGLGDREVQRAAHAGRMDLVHAGRCVAVDGRGERPSIYASVSASTKLPLAET